MKKDTPTTFQIDLDALDLDALTVCLFIVSDDIVARFVLGMGFRVIKVIRVICTSLHTVWHVVGVLIGGWPRV